MAACRRRVTFLAPLRGAPSSSESICAGYAAAGVACGMAQDTARTGAFRVAISWELRPPAAGGPSAPARALEIGPGALCPLTLLALAAGADVLCLESSAEGAAAARQRLAGDPRFVAKWRVLHVHVGAGTPASAAAEAAAGDWHPHLVFGEVLGFLACGEGVARAAAAIQAALARAGAPAPAWVPLAVATFFAPADVSLEALQGAVPPGTTCLVRVAAVGAGAWALADAVPLDSVAAPVFAAGLSPAAGLVEQLALSAPLGPQLTQVHTTQFVAAGPGVVEVNALTTWIWAGLPAGPLAPAARPRRGQPGLRTAFPYGAPGLAEGLDAGVGVDFSSATSDRAAGACAKNWRNLVVLLGQRVALQPGSVLTVTWTVDLTGAAPAYSVSVSWPGGGVAMALGDLYPDWVQMDAAGEGAARGLFAPPT